MSNEIIPFGFESHSIRAMLMDGNPWFVAKDVAEALGYKDTVNAIKQHCRGVVFRHPIVDSLGRTQDVRIINEPDTYRLIVGSNLPEAERFERWLFEDVLPSIRRTGSYIPDPTIEASRLFREIGPSLRAVGIRGEKLAKGTNQVVQRLTGVDLLGMAGVDSAAPSVPDPFDLQLLACWHEVLGEQVLTAREAIQKAQGTALESFLRMVATDRKTPGTISSVRLGKWLHQVADRPIGQWRLGIGQEMHAKMRTWCVSNATQPQYLLQ